MINDTIGGVTQTTTRKAAPKLKGGLFGDQETLPDRLADLMAATDDGISFVKSGFLKIGVVADPGLSRQVLTRPSGISKGKGFKILKFFLGDGLLTSEGDLHRRQRRLVGPVFHPRQILRYTQDAMTASHQRVAQWSDGQQFDMHDEMSSLTLDVVGRALFGSDLSDDADKIAHSLEIMLPEFSKLLRPVGLLQFLLPTPLRRRLLNAGGSIDEVVERLIRERSAELAAGGAPTGTEVGSLPDVLTILLTQKDEETGEPMPHQLVRDEVVTLMLAGHETTAVTLSWTWLELSRNPAARAALEAELHSPAGVAALADGAWEKLTYTRAVIAESMRLHPPAYVIGRRNTEEIELGGHTVAPNTILFVSPYGLQRDPRNWDAALEFRPERWINTDGAYDENAPGAPRGSYLPFGAGARICIGSAFASMEAVLLLGILAAKFRAHVPEGFEPGNMPAVTMRPKLGVPVTLEAY